MSPDISMQEVTGSNLKPEIKSANGSPQELTQEMLTPPNVFPDKYVQEITSLSMRSKNNGSQELSVQTDESPPTASSQEVTIAPVTQPSNYSSINTVGSSQVSQQEEYHLPSQDITRNVDLNDSSNTIIMDSNELLPQLPVSCPNKEVNQKILCIKQQMSNLGLPPNIFDINKDKYFLAESTLDSDSDFLHFTDIMDKNCSIAMDNLSQEDITFEKGLLKMSSPITSSRTQTDDNTDETTIERCDPAYEKPKTAKKSMQPRRAPSASRIALQHKNTLRKPKDITERL